MASGAFAQAVETRKFPGGASGSAKTLPRSSGFKVSSVNIEVSDNGGFMVTAYKEPSVKKASRGPEDYMKPTKLVFETVAELNAYLDKTFGGTK